MRHFFKVGQRRSQGKAMVACLAQQLAEQLPGFPAAVLPATREHGDGGALGLTEAFEAWVRGRRGHVGLPHGVGMEGKGVALPILHPTPSTSHPIIQLAPPQPPAKATAGAGHGSQGQGGCGRP